MEKKPEKKDHPCKDNCTCTKDHNKEYQKKREKEHFPRKIWPTDSENKKKKGPKI